MHSGSEKILNSQCFSKAPEKKTTKTLKKNGNFYA